MPQPRTYRTHALILRHRDFGEADRLITVLTPQHGKFDVLAKGVRKPTSTKTGHLELYTHSELLIARGSSLDLVTQAQLLNPYLALHEDLLRGAYASYCVELLDRFTTVEEDARHDALFELLDATFERLCHDPDVMRVARYYEMQLLDLVGFRPQLQTCVVTQAPIEPRDQYFSFAEGGVVSPEGAAHLSGLVALPLVTLKLMRHFQRTRDYRRLTDLHITPQEHSDFERVMLGFIRHTLEARLRSIDFIRLIQR